MIGKVVHIEKKLYEIKETTHILRKSLFDHTHKDLTVSDASVLSGLPVRDCEEGLIALTKEYPSRIKVTETGEMIFHFYSLKKTKKPSLPVLLYKKIKIFVIRFFELIVLILTMIITIPLALTIGGNSLALWSAIKNASPALGYIFIPLIIIYLALFYVGFLWSFIILLLFGIIPGVVVGGISILTQAVPLILAGKLLHILSAVFALSLIIPPLFFIRVLFHLLIQLFIRGNNPITRFLKKTRDFFFGPPVRNDKLEDERLLTGLIREKGILAISDLMNLFGWDYQKSEQEITRILVDYGGDILITEKGAILYHFKYLMTTTGNKIDHGKASFRAYERFKTPKKFFYCSKFIWISILSVLILGFLGLLFHPKLVLFPGIKDFINLAKDPIPMGSIISVNIDYAILFYYKFLILEGLGGYAYIFPLGVPLIRSIFYFFYRIRHIRLIRFLSLQNKVFDNPNGFYHSEIDKNSLVKLDGTVDINQMNEKNEYYYCFPKIELELKEAEKVRKAVLDKTIDITKLTYDTEK